MFTGIPLLEGKDTNETSNESVLVLNQASCQLISQKLLVTTDVARQVDAITLMNLKSHIMVSLAVIQHIPLRIVCAAFDGQVCNFQSLWQGLN